MIGHYIRVFFRQFLRHKTYQLISVLGLAIGIVAVIVIVAWLRFETSYDNFHAHADRLVRVYEVQEYPNGNLDVAVTPFPLGPRLAQDYPEIESAVRLWFGPGLILNRGTTRAYEAGLIYADKDFFKVFSYPLRSGNPTTALDQKYSVVISGALATKYFGDEDPIGQTLRVNGQYDLSVTGVLAPQPRNSHLDPSMVVSLPTASDDWSPERRESWGTNGYSTYLLLREGTNRADFDARLENAIKVIRGKDKTTRLYAQNVEDIHLGKVLVADNSDVSDPRRLWVFASAALMVLIIACINYVNLATARAGLRYKEFGVRSCLGADLSQMRRQVVGEALAASGVAALLAVVIAELAFPVFRDILSPDLSREVFRSSAVLIALPVTWLLTGLAAGLIPAFMLARKAPVRMLRDQTMRGAVLRRSLVVLQFTVSVVLIIMTAVILRQQGFMRDRSLGADIDQLLVVPLRGEEARSHYGTLREELLVLGGVSKATAVAQLPNQVAWSSTYNWEGQKPDEEVLFNTNSADYEFVETFGLSLAEGRNFRKDESNVCLINETAMKQIGWTSAVGKTMFLSDSLPATVVGVVKDFPFSSLRDEIAPLVIQPAPQDYSNLILRLNTTNLQATMKQIEETAGRVLPNTPYRSFFFNQAFDRLYDAEIRMQQTISCFAVLAIALACLGLFGLATFSIERRTKEVGVRKVLGASLGNIIVLHVKEYIVWLAVANLLAWPIAYWISRDWLAGFAYRTDMPWWIFVATGIASLVLAQATVIVQTIRAASANPVTSLRYE